MKRRRRVGFLLFDGITALDLTGPMEAFGTAKDSTGRLEYELITIGLSKREVVAENGLVLTPSKAMSDTAQLDTIVVPGGSGLRNAATCLPIAKWLGTNAKQIRRIVSICTGVYGVAASGLLDGRRVTTHWRFAQDVQEKFPKLTVDASSIFLVDGKFYTSAGITSGIDLSLALIEEDCGREVALRVARELIVFLKRPGGQEQYSEPLRFQMSSSDKTGDLPAWIEANLQKDLSVQALASKACLSERHFARHFQNLFQTTPAVYVERVRLERARGHLTDTNQTIEAIARAVGFGSDDAFRRAFQKRFDISPTAYRKAFGTQTGEHA